MGRGQRSVSGIFARALAGEALPVPPIWLMRQAGRYQARYQSLRSRYRFEDLCRIPDLSAEVALGPVLDFDFDAAILFSDLLFPLEALGFGLSYDEGPPKLDGSLTLERVDRFRSIDEAAARLSFQREAMAAPQARLPRDKGLIGFVGGPWTLFVYAVEGTHAGALERSKASLDLYRAFADRVIPLLRENVRLQLEGGADIVMVFDTAAGELAPGIFARDIAPDLEVIARAFPGKLGYYAKGLERAHLSAAGWAVASPWAGLGLDWHWDLADALATGGRTGFVQGNFDPARLAASGPALEDEIARFVAPLQRLDADDRRGWICGLGHGVLPNTPEANVRTFVNLVRESFA
jgi:uroporphyrinogen decarboxylase